MKYYNIDENIACTAHGMVHMSDYVLNSATNSYRAAVDKAATLVEERKAKVSNYYHEKLDSILDCYSRRLAEWTNAYNRNQAWQRQLAQSAENAARRILGCEGKGGCNA